MQRNAQEAVLVKDRARQEDNMANNVALRNQISDNHELRERNRQEFLDEGANTWSRIQNHHRLSKRDFMIIDLSSGNTYVARAARR